MKDDNNKPHIRPGDIKYTRGFEIRLFFSKLMSFLLIILFIFIVTGSSYIYIKQPVMTDEGHVTADITYRMYKPKENVVYVETDSYNMFTPLKRYFTNQIVYNAKVIAGPYGEVKQYDDTFKAIHGESTVTVNLEAEEGFYLNEEYIIRKIDNQGNLIENELDRVVTKNEILGLIKSQKSE